VGHGILIVGSSQAGVQLAGSLRALGWDDPITLVGEENHRPYQRPALSKEFLQEKITKESLIFRAPEFWAEHRIDVIPNERIARVEKNADGSGVAYARSGRELPFDRLALTVGARPRRLHLPGIDLPAVLYLRNADDALELKARVPLMQNVVVIGGGFIGIEAAASLTTLGKTVTLIEAGERLMGRAVGPDTAAYVLEQHRANGIRIELGRAPARIVGDGDRVTGVELDGEIIPADVVLVGIGVVPNTELAQTMGLHCDNGIVVDRYGVASDGHTIAVGDVANLPDPSPGADPGARIRFESVNNAVEQAKVAAYALTGRPEEYASVPWFWSNQGDLKLQIAGLSGGADASVVRRDDEKGRHSVIYYRAGRLLAVDAINAPLDFIAVKGALAAGQTIPAAAAADPGIPLKSLVGDA
jgi:NAD(P)H-nitrite reductase